MIKQAIIVIMPGEFIIDDYLNEAQKEGYYITINEDTPYYLSMLDYTPKVIIILKGNSYAYLGKISKILKAKRYKIRIDILMCSYIESISNMVAKALDDPAMQIWDFYNTYQEFIEMISGQDLSFYDRINIVDSNNERYDSNNAIEKITEYCNSIFAFNFSEIAQKRVQAAIDKYVAYHRKGANDNFMFIYPLISKLIEYIENEEYTLN